MVIKKGKQAAQYKAKKAYVAKREAAIVAAGQEIGKLPPMANPQRRKAAAASFRVFCETYFSRVFFLTWSPDHLRVIDKIEKAVREGGLFALAMPRGSGKSALARAAILWAVVNGYRRYPAIIGANAHKAIRELTKIKTICETNLELIADYPEALYPIICLDRVTQRQRGQTYLGAFTRIEWLSEMVVFPTIPESPASGAIISAIGLESGDIRGQSHQLPNGEVIRPDFVFIDDPQTKESAKSAMQNEEREELLSADVLGMAGPGSKISAIMCCTIIRPGDMADRIIDTGLHPDWNGEKTRMVNAWPKNMKLWEKYASIRADGMRAHDGGAAGTVFYLANRAAMDEGAEVAWPEQFYEDELSALQHAMNLRYRDEGVFFAEYQNEPVLHLTSDRMLTVLQVLAKASGHKKGDVPPDCTKLTMFVDVHDDLLYFAVCAWEMNFTGYVIDYGTFPDQRRANFTLAKATKPLGKVFAGAGAEGAIQSGLEQLVAAYLARDWNRGGAHLRIDRLLVDMGYKPKIVAAVKQKAGGATMMLSKGVGIKASRKPIAEYARRPGETIGNYWYVPNVRKTSQSPHVLIDVNYWKSFVQTGFSTVAGDRGSISLFGGKDSRQHELVAEHIAKSESWVEVVGPGGVVHEWSQLPHRPDNHWFDCLVGCAAAASMVGVKVAGETVQVKPRKRKLTQEDFRRR